MLVGSFPERFKIPGYKFLNCFSLFGAFLLINGTYSIRTSETK